MAEFYDLFAEQYEELFRLRPGRAEELESILERPLRGLNLLDAGCATGALTRELARLGALAVGVDLNARMISLARERAAHPVPSEIPTPVYLCDDLLNLGTRFPPGRFQGIFCLGNTLPHLRPPDGPWRFLRLARRLLDSTGVLVLQLVHFEKALARESMEFPVLDTPTLQFHRSYAVQDKNSIHFQARITRKDTGAEKQDTISLQPILRKELLSELKLAGFSPVLIASDFAGTPATADDESSVVVARVAAPV